MGNRLRYIYQKAPASVKKMVVSSIVAANKTKDLIHGTFQPPKSKVYASELLMKYNSQRQFGPQKKLCYAPYSSMFFSIFGKVSPCYSTYIKINSNYPERTLKEIWQGNGFAKIRKQVSQNDLSGICNFCHIPFITENFGSMLAAKYDNYIFYGKKYPSIMEFELSNQCNLQCIMCNGFLSSSIRSHREKQQPVEIKYDSDFVRQLEEFIPHLKVAEFTGGDPLLIDIYYDIWERINQLNPECNILITTNANTKNQKFMDVLSKSKRISFNVSIDSLQRDVYEKIRIGADFDKAMKNISVFSEYCKRNKTTLNFLVCPLRLNWKELPAFIEYGNANSINIFFHTVIKPESLVLWSLPSSDLKEISDYLNTFDFPEHKSIEKQNKKNYFHLVDLISTWQTKAKDREKDEKFKYTLIETSEKESIFIKSVLDFIKNKNESIPNTVYQKCESIENKIKSIFNKLPSDFDKGQFLNHLLKIEIDDFIIVSIEKTDEKTLSELIVNWVFYN